MGFNGLPPTLAPNSGLVPFAGLSAVKSESVPGFSGASGNAPLPPAAPGGYDQTLDWSASWNSWDGAPVDTSGEWHISLRTTDGSTQTVNVTPRRPQAFSVTPGAYAWENRRATDNVLVASGNAVCVTSGLVTVAGFSVTPTGNRLVLLKAASSGPYRVSFSLSPLRLTPSDHGKDATVTWDAAHCPSAGYHLVYGYGSSLASWGVEGGLCSLGTAGTALWTDIPTPSAAQRFLWFVVVGDDGGHTEGSWGVTSLGTERGGTGASGVCGMTAKDTSGSCTTP